MPMPVPPVSWFEPFVYHWIGPWLNRGPLEFHAKRFGITTSKVWLKLYCIGMYSDTLLTTCGQGAAPNNA